jgi:lysozyme
MIDALDEAILEAAASKLTVPFEGVVLHPYQDVRGIWTIGTGSIYDLAGNRVTADTPPITPAQNLQLLAREMASCLQSIRADTPAPLTSPELAALVDLVFNIGSGNYHASSIRKCLLAGDYDGACQHIADWNQASGQVLAGLVRRRAAEQVEFKSSTL